MTHTPWLPSAVCCSVLIMSTLVTNSSWAQSSTTRKPPVTPEISSSAPSIRVANQTAKEVTFVLRRWVDAKGKSAFSEESYRWIKPKEVRRLTINGKPFMAAKIDYSLTTEDGSTHWDSESLSGANPLLAITDDMLPKSLVGSRVDVTLKSSGVFDGDDYKEVEILDVRRTGGTISSIVFDWSGNPRSVGSSAIVKLTIGSTELVYDQKAKRLVDKVFLEHRQLVRAEKERLERELVVATAQLERKRQAEKAKLDRDQQAEKARIAQARQAEIQKAEQARKVEAARLLAAKIERERAKQGEVSFTNMTTKSLTIVVDKVDSITSGGLIGSDKVATRYTIRPSETMYPGLRTTRVEYRLNTDESDATRRFFAQEISSRDGKKVLNVNIGNADLPLAVRVRKGTLGSQIRYETRQETEEKLLSCRSCGGNGFRGKCGECGGSGVHSYHVPTGKTYQAAVRNTTVSANVEVTNNTPRTVQVIVEIDAIFKFSILAPTPRRETGTISVGPNASKTLNITIDAAGAIRRSNAYQVEDFRIVDVSAK